MKAVTAIGLAFMASTAIANPVLWGKVEADMPFATARALYPDAHVNSGKGLFKPMITWDQEVDGCKMTVAINIDRKVAEPDAKVSQVELWGEGCDSKMFTQLVGKYGEPTTSNFDNEKQKRSARWVADGRSIHFKSRAGKGFASDFWEITYAPLKDMGL